MVSLGTQPANRKSGFGHSSPTGARAQDLSRQPARPDLWGARVSNDPGLPDHAEAPRARHEPAGTPYPRPTDSLAAPAGADRSGPSSSSDARGVTNLTLAQSVPSRASRSQGPAGVC